MIPRQTARLCSGCGKICDGMDPNGHPRRWVDARMFLTKYGWSWDDLDFYHTFCVECRRVVQAGSGTKSVGNP